MWAKTNTNLYYFDAVSWKPKSRRIYANRKLVNAFGERWQLVYSPLQKLTSVKTESRYSTKAGLNSLNPSHGKHTQWLTYKIVLIESKKSSISTWTRRPKAYTNTLHCTQRYNRSVWTQKRLNYSSSLFLDPKVQECTLEANSVFFWTVHWSVPPLKMLWKISRWSSLSFQNTTSNKFFVHNMISPGYFKDRFMLMFGPVAFVFQHCWNFFSIFQLFELNIDVVVSVIRRLELTKVTGASLGFGQIFLSASNNILLISVLTSM